MSGCNERSVGRKHSFPEDHSPDLHGHHALTGYNSINGQNGSNGTNVSKQVVSRIGTLDEALFSVFDAFVASFRRQSALTPAAVRVGDQVDVFADDDFLMRGWVVDLDSEGNVKVEGAENGQEVTLWVSATDCRHADGQMPPKTRGEWEKNRGVFRVTER